MDIDLLLVQVVEQPEGGGEQEKRPKTSADKSEDDSVTGALSDQEPPKEVIKTERESSAWLKFQQNSYSG